MRRTPALIVGGGPAGCAAAITLSRNGLSPLLVERSTGERDVVCGGFLGWDALASLDRLGLDPWSLGARPIGRLRLFSRKHHVEAPLPHRAAGLSRRKLDAALIGAAAAAGVEVLPGRTVRAAAGGTVRLEDGEEIATEALFLATGKHELRGVERGADLGSAPVGLRASIAAPPNLEGAIELHLFDGGYAGLLLQEDGRANLCLSVSRARLKQAGGIEPLIEALMREEPRLRERVPDARADWMAVAGVPYGWRARGTAAGQYRVGDQAAVIASIAGDGIAIALASGVDAARALVAGNSAASFQQEFARRSRIPVAVSEMLRRVAERAAPRSALMGLIGRMPALAGVGARLTRIG